MDKNELRDACFAFEEGNGIDCFLETMADIVADLLAGNGLPLDFDGEAEAPGTRREDDGAGTHAHC